MNVNPLDNVRTARTKVMEAIKDEDPHVQLTVLSSLTVMVASTGMGKESFLDIISRGWDLYIQVHSKGKQ